MPIMSQKVRAAMVAILACAFLLIATATAPAQIVRRIRSVPGQPGMIMLPYNVADNQGNQWMVFQSGMLRMQGNMPVFSQAGQLTINGQVPNMMNNQARLEDKTSDLIIENMPCAAFTVTRRITFNNTDDYVRVIDSIKNTQGQDQQANIQLSSNLNFGVQSSAFVPDPKKKDQNLAWVVQLAGVNRAGFDIYCGRNA